MNEFYHWQATLRQKALPLLLQMVAAWLI